MALYTCDGELRAKVNAHPIEANSTSTYRLATNVTFNANSDVIRFTGTKEQGTRVSKVSAFAFSKKRLSNLKIRTKPETQDAPFISEGTK